MDPNALPWWERRRRWAVEMLVGRAKTVGAFDAAGFLFINGLPRPHAANVLMHAVSRTMLHAELWVAVVIGWILASPGAGREVLIDVVPALWLATLTVNYPVKRVFRRRRPFLHLVDAVVVGRHPKDHSFPSGHTAGAFAGAWLLAPHLPEWSWALYGYAALVGFSRVYLGVHYPGDVAVGGAVGVLLAFAYRWLVISLI